MLLEFRDGVGAHVLGDAQVALIGEDVRTVLSGKVYAVVAPLIDGTRSADEVVRDAEGLSATLAYYAIERLKALDLLAKMPSESPLAATTAPRVRCIGVDAAAGEALAARLGPLPQPVTVVLADDYLRPELAEEVAAVADSAFLLPVRPVGVSLWFGPLIGPGIAAVDWPALVARIRMNRPADATVLDAGVPLPLWRPRSTPAELDLALAFAAGIITRAMAGDTAVASGAIVTLDAQSMETAWHRLPEPVRPIDRPVAIKLADGVKTFRADGGHRTKAPHETLETLMRFVSPITGLFPRLVRMEAPEPLHVYGTPQRMAGAAAHHGENRLLGASSGAVGKGESAVQAKVSCLAEAVERYSCGEFPDSSRVRASYDELGEAAVHPHDMLGFSEAQYAARSNPPRFYGEGFNMLQEPFDPTVAIEWTPVWSLTNARARYVPTRMCHFGATDRAGPAFAHADSNGCASGNTLEEAILQGLLELVERDACALWWYNRIPRPEIALASFHHPYFDRAASLYAGRNQTLRLIDITSDLGVPVFVAINTDAEGRNVRLGLGCHLDPRLAVSRAICELNQIAAVDLPADAPLMKDAAARHFNATASAATDRYLAPSNEPALTADDFDDQSTPTLRGDIELIVDRLKAAGVETLVLDHTRPEIGFPVARVIAPGLRHFWGRLAPGRLYDVPVAMGWLKRPLAEAELNPIPFFL